MNVQNCKFVFCIEFFVWKNLIFVIFSHFQNVFEIAEIKHGSLCRGGGIIN